jgi:hypothetical protein
MSLINAGPGVCVVAAAAAFVGAVVGFTVGEAWMIFVGAVVGFITGAIAVGTVTCLVGAAAFGAQAASVTVSTNSALVRNLVFISITPFLGKILAFSIKYYAR